MFRAGLAIGFVVIVVLLIGLVVSFTFGVLVMAWLTAASRADDVMEQEH